jgi:hypothetical protein
MLDFLRATIRSAIGAAEHVEAEVEHHSPVAVEERKLHDAVAALHRATESLEKHVEVVETLAASLTPLTQSVTRLTDQIGELLRITAPLAAAEREVGRLEHLFGRHRHEGPPPDAEERPGTGDEPSPS